MDLREKVAQALREHLHPERIELEDDGGISGIVVAEQFRGMPALDRQTLLENILRSAPEKLTKAEMRRILAIAALTPVEYASFGPRE
jgi:hypothetical protein